MLELYLTQDSSLSHMPKSVPNDPFTFVLLTLRKKHICVCSSNTPSTPTKPGVLLPRTRVHRSTYSKQRRKKSRNVASQFFKATLRSLEFGRRFFPFEFVIQRGLPLESGTCTMWRISETDRCRNCAWVLSVNNAARSWKPFQTQTIQFLRKYGEGNGGVTVRLYFCAIVRPRQNEDTLWRQQCVPRCCPSVARRGSIRDGKPRRQRQRNN